MRSLLTGLLLSGATLYYAVKIEPEWIQVTRKTLTLPRLHPDLNGYRIAQISDIHADGRFERRHLLEEAVQLVNNQHPDLIVLTGDFFTRRASGSPDRLIAALRCLCAPDGVVAVPGNHDYMTKGGIGLARYTMRASGITDLSNRFLTISRGQGQLHVAGVDDVIARRARLDLLLAELPPTGAAVLLAHEPDFADVSAATHRFDLQLSGHTHGGQVRFPLLGALRHSSHGLRYSMGLGRINGMYVYVNRGLGTVTLPLRFNCRPEVTVFTLESASLLRGSRI